MIPKLIAALNHVLSSELTDEDVADILWLALKISAADRRGTAEPLSKDEASPEEDSISRPVDKPPLPFKEGRGIIPPCPVEPLICHPVRRTVLSTRILDPRPSKSPAAAALPNTLELARSLRPLTRRVPSHKRFVLDEQSTAQAIAEQGIWLPVMKPAFVRWLELALVVDRADPWLCGTER